MSKNEKEKTYKVLRVTQLDADQIDNSIFNLLKSFFVDSLNVEPLNRLLNFEPELSACLQSVLWYFSVYKQGKTIGQNMLGTEFIGSNQKTISTFQRYGLLTTVFIQWVRNRETLLVKLMDKLTSNSTNDVAILRIFKYVETCSEILMYVNTLLFLSSGNHVSILERCLSLKHVYTGKPYPRYIDYDYIRKEMVWDAVTKTIMCLLPLVNFKKIFYHLNRVLTSKKMTPKDSADLKMVNMRCCLCHEILTNPYQVGCSHWFCYFCLMANLMDGSFTCNVCGLVTETFEPVAYEKHG